MLELFMTFFDHTGGNGPEAGVAPHLRTEEFDIADGFICSLNLSDEEKPAPLIH